MSDSDVMNRAQQIVQETAANCTGYPCEVIMVNAVERAKLEAANARLTLDIVHLSEQIEALKNRIQSRT